jgi:ABC-2 type transport system permease protein
MRGVRLFWKQVWVDLKLHLRTRVAVFWEFVFPVVMILLFFLAFGREEGGVSLKLGLVDLDRSGLSQAMVEAFHQVPILDLVEAQAQEEKELQVKLEAGKLDGLVIIPAGFQAALSQGEAQLKLLVYSGSNPQVREILISAVQRLISGFNERLQRPPIALAQEMVTARAGTEMELEEVSYIDFVLPGILATAILASALMAGAIGLAFERESKLLKLLGTTPLHPLVFFSARAVQQFIVTILQALVLVGLSVLFLGARVQGSYALLALLFTLASLSFILMGFAIAALSKTHEAATGLANIFYMPMVFASGAFFPIRTMPAWLQPIMRVLPLRFFLDGFRDVTIRGAGLPEIAPNLAVLAGWGLVCLLITVRFFRWASEA